MKYLLLLIALIGSMAAYAQSSTELTIMTYNILNYPNPSNNSALGNDAARAGYFRQIVEATEADVILIQEMTDLSGATLLVNELNTNGTLGKTYNHAPGYTNYGTLGNMLIYNDDVLNFISQQELSRPSSGGSIAPRATTRYRMTIDIACGGVSGVPIELYSSHFKASTDEASGNQLADRDLRDLEANNIMTFINGLSATTNIIVAGDFNFYSDNISGSTYSEPAYGSLTSTGNTQRLYDKQNGWTRNNSSNAFKYTQATRGQSESINLYGNDGVPGGLDDRFDHIFINPAINNADNMIAYVSGSYQTFGSPGILNADATAGNVPLENEIKIMSDHYPVLMDLLVCENVVVACPAPTNGTASNIGSSSAELSWSATQTAFDVEWGLAGFSPGTGTTVSGVSNPYTLSGLASQTSYEYYVCGQCTDTLILNSEDLIITGAYDGPLTGGTPKGVELYVVNDISDLSLYGLSSANNGAGTTGTPEFTFPSTSVTAGTYLYVTVDAAQFAAFFGFNPDYITDAMFINGDDAVELFYNGTVIDVLGDVNTDGSNTPWDHLDGWAYRNNNQPTNAGVFNVSNWTFSGVNQLEGGTTNATTNNPFPLASYTPPTSGIQTDLSECAGPFSFTTGTSSCPAFLTVNGTIGNQLYQADNTINSAGSLPPGNAAQFKAGQVICLENGFTIPVSADFSAEIEGCN